MTMTRSSSEPLLEPLINHESVLRSLRKSHEERALEMARDLELEMVELRRQLEEANLKADQQTIRVEEAELRANAPREPQSLGLHMLPTPKDPILGVVPIIPADRFEIKNSLIHLLQNNQFGGGIHEDPNDHIKRFTDLIYTANIGCITLVELNLNTFKFTLRDRAMDWYIKHLTRNDYNLGKPSQGVLGTLLSTQ